MDMKYRVSLLPIFEQDVLRISEALQEYPSVAKRLFEELDKKLLMLEDRPYIWPVYQTNPKFRHMLLENHSLFYMVDESNQRVKVYRLLYGKMDAPKHLDA